MNRYDYRLVAAVLAQAIKDGLCEPRVAVSMAAAFSKRGDPLPEWKAHEFLMQAVPSKQRKVLFGEGKISPGKTPEPKKEERVLVEDDAALFNAIMSVEFPHLANSVRCALSMRQPARFQIGRVGSHVWIRFGGQALEDPIGAVRAAAPDAEKMALCQTDARRIVGR